MEHRILKCSVLVLFSAVAYCLRGQSLAGAAINKDNTIKVKSYHIVTNLDADKIKRSAINVVKEFGSDLNTFSLLPGMDSSEVIDAIRKRCSDENQRIFYDSTATIEDDIWRTTGNDDKKLQVKPVRRYLSDFDLYYKKNDSRTVFFSNIETSNVKKGDYIYVLVFYDCLFTGRSKFSDEPYTTNKRVAELRVEKAKDKWRAWIINVRFLNHQDALNKNKNDISVVEAGNDNVADSLFKIGKKFLELGQLKEAEDYLITAVSMEPQNALYNYTLAELYQQKRQYDEAIELYSKVSKMDANRSMGSKPGIEIGNIYLEMNQSDSAYKCFNKIYMQDSTDAESIYGMAITQMQMKRIGWALACFEDAFKSGKIHRNMIKNDKRLDEIREDKAFKSLVKKYL